MARRRSWSEMSTGYRVAVVVGGLVELVLLIVAGRDLRSRPAAEVRGPKWLWVLLLPIQPVGPIAYLLVGRR